jgi:cytidyltransferase-like protein
VIVATAELSRHRNAVAMVDGGFDPLHAGHVEYFRRAAELGLPVLCNVISDSYVSSKHRPLLPEEQRVQVIDAIRYIDYTHLADRMTTAGVLRELQPRFYVKGRDWEGRLPEEEVAICERFGIEIVFLDTVLESSSRILAEYVSSGGEKACR